MVNVHLVRGHPLPFVSVREAILFFVLIIRIFSILICFEIFQWNILDLGVNLFETVVARRVRRGQAMGQVGIR